jgi:acetylornithine deacetylase
MRLCIAHKGFVWLEVETRGRAAHGSRPDLGVDAIARMGTILSGIEGLAGELSRRPAHPLLGTGSVHASLIEGGQELSTYPDRCLLQLERRTVPGESPDEVAAEIRRLAGENAEVRVTFVREPFEVGESEAIVGTLRRLAGEPEVIGVPFWADSAIFQAAGIPTVVFGPGGEGAHALEEWVSLADAERCADLYLAAAVELCG